MNKNVIIVTKNIMFFLKLRFYTVFIFQTKKKKYLNLFFNKLYCF